MSTQIAIAQDREDERLVVAWLAERGAWEYLPRTARRPLVPSPLDHALDRAQDLVGRTILVFPPAASARVMEGVLAAQEFNGLVTRAASPSVSGRP